MNEYIVLLRLRVVRNWLTQLSRALREEVPWMDRAAVYPEAPYSPAFFARDCAYGRDIDAGVWIRQRDGRCGVGWDTGEDVDARVWIRQRDRKVGWDTGEDVDAGVWIR